MGLDMTIIHINHISPPTIPAITQITVLPAGTLQAITQTATTIGEKVYIILTDIKTVVY